MFVEVDSVSHVLGGGGEGKHEIRVGTCLGVQNPKAVGIDAELCNEEGVMGEGWDTDEVGDEEGNDVIGSRRKGAIPIGPIRRGGVHVVVVEDISAQKVGYLLDEALLEESEFSVSVGYVGEHGGDACLLGYQPVGC